LGEERRHQGVEEKGQRREREGRVKAQKKNCTRKVKIGDTTEVRRANRHCTSFKNPNLIFKQKGYYGNWLS